MNDDPGTQKNAAFDDTATVSLSDAIAVYREIAEVLDGYGYLCGLYGSTIMRGGGHDVDLLCIAKRRFAPPPSMVMTGIEARGWTIRDVHDSYGSGHVGVALQKGAVVIDLRFAKTAIGYER